MSRRLSISAAIILASVFAASGCSSGSNSTLVPFSGAAGVQETQPFTGSWTTKAPLLTAQRFLAAGVVNGLLYAVGGAQGGNDLNTLEVYDHLTNTWTFKASMPTPRENLGVGVINGILYAVGGNKNGAGALTTVEAYNPATDSWNYQSIHANGTKRASCGCRREQTLCHRRR
jgi:hypothetical protein